MTKIPQNKEDLEQHLKEQLEFLQSSVDSFDDGKENEAKRMAVHLRTLLHDTNNSTSLLKLLGIKDNISYLDSSFQKLEGQETFGSYAGLVVKAIGPTGGKYVAPLDELIPGQSFSPTKFEKYWNGIIFVDINGNGFSRKDLVLAIANKDGGAHVDPELDQEYVDLTRLNSLGWIYGNALEEGGLGNASLAAVRQITHEILKTLIPEYPEKKMNSEMEAMFGEILLQRGFMPGVLVGYPSSRKMGRNEKCFCGSGLKWKKCGLINSQFHNK